MTPPESPANQTATDDALLRMQGLVNRLFSAVVAVLVVVAALTLSVRYLEAVGEGRREAGNLADLLSEYLVIRLRGIDGALSRIATDNRLIGGPEGSEREWATALRSAIAGVTGLSSLVVLDEDGVVRQATVQQIRGLSWADRKIFRELERGVPNMVVVDLPITMVAGNQILVPFARALTDPRGDFMGAVIALLLPQQLRDFLGAFDLGQSGLAWVLLPSGDVLFRDGAVDALGPMTNSEAPLFAAEAVLEGDGVVSGPLVPDGADYITAYRKSAIADLVVAVSIADPRSLSRWKYEAVIVSIVVALAAVLLFLAARRIKAAGLDIVAAGHIGPELDKPG